MYQAEVLAHHALAEHYRRLRLHAPAVATTAQPGQFVMLSVVRDDEAAPVLPRPMAVYDADPTKRTIDVLYGVVGAGTTRLAGFRVGETLTVLGPLGRWFEIGSDVRSVLLLGRGIGTCSLTTVARAAQSRSIAVTAVTSARHPDVLIGAELYRQAGVRAVRTVTDAHGTSDPETLFAALTAELDDRPPELIMTCGSTRLIGLAQRLAGRWVGARIQVSVEAHMACGLGYCHGCSSGGRGEGAESPLVCADGPVFGWAPQVGG